MVWLIVVSGIHLIPLQECNTLNLATNLLIHVNRAFSCCFAFVSAVLAHTADPNGSASG